MIPSRRVAIVLIVATQCTLLTYGITRDYRLKHEDNNALHATFARSHLQLGLQTTRGQNYFYSPSSGTGVFYSNHPPGPGLVLAAVYWVTGADGPAVTRATAVAFHMMSTVLLFGLARRVFDRETDAVLTACVFVILPESAFFGRMVNHEVLALPGALVLVRAYWELLHPGPRRGWSLMALGSCVWLGLMGWVGFFAIAGCCAHAGWEVVVRSNGRARAPFLMLAMAAVAMFAIDIAHLAWLRGGDLRSLADLLQSRTHPAGAGGLVPWLGRIIELHWRYFSLTSLFALGALAYRASCSLRGAQADRPAEIGLVFLVAGSLYVIVFGVNAAQHDYWQFLLLPASAFAVTLLYRWVRAKLGTSQRRGLYVALLAIGIAEMTVTVSVTLGQRHLNTEAYCLETVEQLRRNAL